MPKSANKRLLVVMPAYNESAAIKETLSNVATLVLPSNWAYEVLVVDDGSSDSTKNIALSSGVLVASHPFNCGVGIALRTGFRYAQIHNFDAVIQIDADGQHLGSEIIKLIDALESEHNDIVIGSRFLEGSWNTSRSRRIAMKILARLVSFGTTTSITDATSGFRISSNRAIQLFAEEYPGEYLGDTVESLILAHKRGLKIKEVSAQLQERQAGQASHLTLRSTLHVARVFVMTILRISKPKKSGSQID